MICLYCKNEIDDHSKFCGKCGNKIPRCPSCGQVITRKMRFCLNDGTPIPEDILVLISDENKSDADFVAEVAEAISGSIDSSETYMNHSDGVLQDDMKLEEMPDDPLKTNHSTPKDVQIGTVPIEHSAPRQTHFCVQCGSPCEEGQLLCAECQHRAREEDGPEHKKKQSPVLAVLMVILLLLVAGGTLVAMKYFGQVFQQETAEKTEISEGRSVGETEIIDRTVTEENISEGVEVADYPENETADNQETVTVDEREEKDDSTYSEAQGSNKPDEEKTEIYGERAASEESGIETDREEVTIYNSDAQDMLEYFILNSDRQYFSEADIRGFDADACRIARNGIYARLGRKFQDTSLQQYFERYDWYHPTIEPEDFAESMLNDYQVANRDLVVDYETQMGYR